MKNKDLTIKDKFRGVVILNYHFMEFEIKKMKKKCELGKISKDYLDGYLRGITDFKNVLMETDIQILKEEKE